MAREFAKFKLSVWSDPGWTCLLYTSDAADDIALV